LVLAYCPTPPVVRAKNETRCPPWPGGCPGPVLKNDAFCPTQFPVLLAAEALPTPASSVTAIAAGAMNKTRF